MKYLLTIFFLVTVPFLATAESIPLEKKDYLKLIASNYVHGFKTYGTSVVAYSDSISIYYDANTQTKEKANVLSERIKYQLPIILKSYEWAKGVKVIVNVYSEIKNH